MRKTDSVIEIISYSGFLMVRIIAKHAIKAEMKAKTVVNLLPILSPINYPISSFIRSKWSMNLPKYFPTI
jgi:hypothetical protein